MSPIDLRQSCEYADIQTIGIPQALLHYRYHVLWRTFFEALDRTVVVSEPSDRSTLEAGALLSVDECCLASKLYLGHVQSLLPLCDALFVPSIDNLGLHQEFCTKFQALPDLVLNSFPRGTVRIVSCEVDDLDTHISEHDAFVNMAMKFGVSKKRAQHAYEEALQAQQQADKKQAHKQAESLKKIAKLSKQERPLRILLVAHPYVIHDTFVGGPITTTLEELGVFTLFADAYDHQAALEKSFEFSDTMPWITNRELIGALLSLYEQVDGVVIVSAFPCGPDSMTNDALMRCIKGKPLLSLTVDAQSGTAGLETRLESFVDILNYQRKGGYLHG